MSEHLENWLEEFELVETFEEISFDVFKVEISKQTKGLYFREKVATETGYQVVDSSNSHPIYYIRAKWII